MTDDDERLRRWRLLLGADPLEASGEGQLELDGDDRVVDRALAALYDRGARQDAAGSRTAGLGASAPRVTQWLTDIRSCFPTSVVQVLQADAMERLELATLLKEPEFLAAMTPDIHLANMLIQLADVLPERARAAAREVVRAVVEEIERRIRQRTVATVTSAINRSARTSRPRPSDIDWPRTIAANLRHYLPEHRTVVPHRLVGHARRRTGVQREVIVALDQSGSMADSVVFGSIFAAVLSTMSSLRTRLVVFDTAVVDLTELLSDPIDLLFATQLGGGTDINGAVTYCSQLVTKPAETILVLVSDLFEGGDRASLLRRVRALHASGVTMLALLALDDSGTPAFDHALAGQFAALGVPAFACTPDVFPEVLEVAINGGDLAVWAQAEAAARAEGPAGG
ncbi:VWA domain-containing protein [Granulicoccus sp. GXG6511]|uniref:VWA domain-containing protein n=1 Tax=Granulicoccus sp. GXG6511 TaxID=3381351 RepID=UPI003D7D707E